MVGPDHSLDDWYRPVVEYWYKLLYLVFFTALLLQRVVASVAHNSASLVLQLFRYRACCRTTTKVAAAPATVSTRALEDPLLMIRCDSRTNTARYLRHGILCVVVESFVDKL
jgi:hypothetical protein